MSRVETTSSQTLWSTAYDGSGTFVQQDTGSIHVTAFAIDQKSRRINPAILVIQQAALGVGAEQ